MEFTVNPCNTDIHKCAGVACLSLHIAKEGLPTAVNMANGVPDIPIKWGNPTHLQFTKHGSNAHTAECTGVAGLTLHIAEARLPSAIGVPERMPDAAIRSNPT